MEIKKLIAKDISFDAKKKRNYEDIKYIVIHYTGNSNDTAYANARYFATTNSRQAGAHFFVDKKGEIYKSVNINRTAWAVGGLYNRDNGAGEYYRKCTNANSVSIELCDCTKGTNDTQIEATKELIAYIMAKCPNARKIIRHWDVNGKCCPDPFAGKYNSSWKAFIKKITS